MIGEIDKLDEEEEIAIHKDDRSKLTYVWCTLTFVGFHRWKEAEGEVAFLRLPHRHVFHVKASVKVKHDDRDVEFITLKNQIQTYVREKYENKTFSLSCEMIAEDILTQFQLNEVSISEDAENGATVYAL